MSPTANSSRRGFLIATAAGVTCSSSLAFLQAGPNETSGIGTPDPLSNPRRSAIQEVTSETFADLQGTRFCIRDREGYVMQTELTEVIKFTLQRSDRRPATYRKPFALTFRLPAGRSLPQSTCWVEHEQLGEFEMFLVPVASPGEASSVEAIFA